MWAKTNHIHQISALPQIVPCSISPGHMSKEKETYISFPAIYLVSLQKLLLQSLSENVLELVEAFHPETGKELLKKRMDISKAKKKKKCQSIEVQNLLVKLIIEVIA
jgi:hypothetical protein